MKVIIQGGGISGLSTALRLSRVKNVDKVIVLERTKKSSFTSGHLGLWTNALNVLRLALGESSFSALISAKNCAFVQDSGYRNIKGEWLMKPKNGVSLYDGKSPSLGFIRNEAILSTLQRALSESAIDMRYEETVESIKCHSGGSIVITSSGKELPCDLLVAADGSNSSLLHLMSSKVTGGKDMTTAPADRGYYVYRGYLSKQRLASVSNASLASSFQTWGAGGLRFAVVPASGGGISWFAAVTQPEQANMRDAPRSNEEKVIAGPFSNESWPASRDDLVNLRSTFSDWHEPIPDLITLSLESRKGSDGSTSGRENRVASSRKKGRVDEDASILEMERVSMCRAVASQGGPPKGSNGTFTISNDNAGGSSETSTISIASVGDAFFTFDPILAVGGGQAVVSGDLLANSLEKYPDVSKALQEYEMEASTRAQVLSVISDIAQTLGSVKSPVMRAYIDVVLTWLLPSGAKARGMDSLIRLTAGVS